MGDEMILGVAMVLVLRCFIEECFISARTCCTWKSSYDSLFLFLLSRRSGGSASVHAPVDVLLFLLGWFQDLSNRTCQRFYAIEVFFSAKRGTYLE